MAINWGMAQQPNALAMMLQGYDEGKKMRREEAGRNAMMRILSGGTQQPTGQTPGIGDGLPGAQGGAPQAPDFGADLGAVAQVDPGMAMKLHGVLDERNIKARRAQLIPLAQQGDRNAAIELMGIDPQTAKLLSDEQKAGIIDAGKYLSEAAFNIVTLPENQRAAAWDSYIEQGTARFPGLAQYRGKYSPQALQSAVAQAGQMQEFMTFQQPKYVPVGENGLQGFQYGKPIGEGQPPATGQASQTPIIPTRPAGKTDSDLLREAREAIDGGAPYEQVFKQLDAWGVKAGGQ